MMIFHPGKANTFCLVSFLAKKKKDACQVESIFFSPKKACHTKSFCSRMMKNHQFQHKGKLHTQEKFQGAAITVEDAMIIIRGLNFFGVHCSVRQFG